MIKAAIVGLGWWGRIIRRELAAKRGHSARARRRSRRRGRARRPRRRGSRRRPRFEDALARADIEAVILATPHKHHAARSLPPPRPASTCSARSRSAPARGDGRGRRGRDGGKGAARHRSRAALRAGHHRSAGPARGRRARHRARCWRATSARTSSSPCPPTTGGSRPRTRPSGRFPPPASISSICRLPCWVGRRRCGRGLPRAAAHSPMATRWGS